MIYNKMVFYAPIFLLDYNLKSYVATLCNYMLGKFIVCTYVPYSKKLWRRKNFGEFGESQQFANFFHQFPSFL